MGSKMETIYWLRVKFYKLVDTFNSFTTAFTSGFKDAMAGKTKEEFESESYVRTLQKQIKEFKKLRTQGIVNNWDEYKTLKEKQE